MRDSRRVRSGPLVAMPSCLTSMLPRAPRAISFDDAHVYFCREAHLCRHARHRFLRYRCQKQVRGWNHRKQRELTQQKRCPPRRRLCLEAALSPPDRAVFLVAGANSGTRRRKVQISSLQEGAAGGRWRRPLLFTEPLPHYGSDF